MGINEAFRQQRVNDWANKLSADLADSIAKLKQRDEDAELGKAFRKVIQQFPGIRLEIESYVEDGELCYKSRLGDGVRCYTSSLIDAVMITTKKEHQPRQFNDQVAQLKNDLDGQAWANSGRLSS